MGAKYTESQRKATETYMKDKHQLRVFVPKEDAVRYKEYARAQGKSLNKFIIECIEKEICNDACKNC